MRDYVGRIAIGRIFNGRVGDAVAVVKLDTAVQHTKVTKLYAFDGPGRVDIQRQRRHRCLAGIEDITIGETITDMEHRSRSRRSRLTSRPCMIFGVNTAGGRPLRHVTPAEGSPDRSSRQRLDQDGADRDPGAIMGSVAASCSCRF
jgi:predicted membrane GTPase involved in stress response